MLDNVKDFVVNFVIDKVSEEVHGTLDTVQTVAGTVSDSVVPALGQLADAVLSVVPALV